MHVVIVGCGRVGSALAHARWTTGTPHRSSTAAATPSSGSAPASPARRSSASASTATVLVEAGIEERGALAAVTNGDNSNILVARVARETFGIERVVARIYDPQRAAVYQRLGIPTVATVLVDHRARAAPRAAEARRPSSGPTRAAGVAWSSAALGTAPGPARRSADVDEAADVRVVAHQPARRGDAADARSIVTQEGDIVYLAVGRSMR